MRATRRRSVLSALLLGAALATPSVAVADGRADGKDLKARLPVVATVEGAWSMTLTSGLLASGGLLTPPFDEGLLDLAATRILYGTTFSVGLASAGVIAEAIGGGWGWLDRAEYRTSWLIGVGVPGACDGFGAPAGCGLGLGTSSEVRAMWSTAPVGGGLTMGAEWIQGRVDRDGVRTLMESTWVLSPIGVRVELPAGGDVVRFTPGLGAGVYGGLHHAHLHQASSIEVTDAPFELVPLHGGAGPGVTPDVTLTILERLRLEGSLALAPFLLGAARERDLPFAPELREPDRDGVVTWRRASASLTVRPPGFPFWMGVRYWAGELSRRSLSQAGHQAVAVAFDVPLRE